MKMWKFWKKDQKLWILWKGKSAALCLVADISERNPAEQEKQAFLAQLFQAQKIEGPGARVATTVHDFNKMPQSIIGACRSMAPLFLQLPCGTHTAPKVRSRCWKIG